MPSKKQRAKKKLLPKEPEPIDLEYVFVEKEDTTFNFIII
jgi:hypothetical protein